MKDADVPSVTVALSAAMEISGVVGAVAPGQVSVDAIRATLTFWPVLQDRPWFECVALELLELNGVQEKPDAPRQSL